MSEVEALRAYLVENGWHADRMGNWNQYEGIGLAQHAFLAGWRAARSFPDSVTSD